MMAMRSGVKDASTFDALLMVMAMAMNLSRNRITINTTCARAVTTFEKGIGTRPIA